MQRCRDCQHAGPASLTALRHRRVRGLVRRDPLRVTDRRHPARARGSRTVAVLVGVRYERRTVHRRCLIHSYLIDPRTPPTAPLSSTIHRRISIEKPMQQESYANGCCPRAREYPRRPLDRPPGDRYDSAHAAMVTDLHTEHNP
jgi:hypothetical protein